MHHVPVNFSTSILRGNAEQYNVSLTLHTTSPSADFLTPTEYTSGATATEIITANAKTISMLKKIQSALFDGFNQIITSDSILLGVSTDLWTLNVDWYDPFEDVTAQYDRIFAAAQNGFAEDEDVIKWLFPNLSPEEIEEKKQRIKANRQTDTDNSLETLLRG